jgi:hypothetical protein
LLSHHRKYGTRHVQRAEKVRRQLRLELRRREFLKETSEEVTSVVDQHINPAETVQRGLHRCFCLRLACDVKFDNEQVVGLADRIGHGLGVAAGRDHRVSGGEGRPSNLDTHTPPCTSDEPNPLVSHVRQSSRVGWIAASSP